MTAALDFVSPDRCDAGVVLASPLARALAGEERIRDLSHLGKLELRGDVESVEAGGSERLYVYGPRRALLVCDEADTSRRRAELAAAGLTVFDVTGGLAGIEMRGETLFRRLSRLDPSALPAAGSFARSRAVVAREGDAFRVFVGQEVGHFVCEFVLDAMDGLD